jgi:hypothetical protein
VVAYLVSKGAKAGVTDKKNEADKKEEPETKGEPVASTPRAN